MISSSASEGLYVIGATQHQIKWGKITRYLISQYALTIWNCILAKLLLFSVSNYSFLLWFFYSPNGCPFRQVWRLGLVRLTKQIPPKFSGTCGLTHPELGNASLGSQKTSGLAHHDQRLGESPYHQPPARPQSNRPPKRALNSLISGSHNWPWA